MEETKLSQPRADCYRSAGLEQLLLQTVPRPFPGPRRGRGG